MAAPADDIHGCAGAHRRLGAVVADIGDADVGAASGLPSWTVGHVLTHLARNAEAMCRRIDAAAQGQVIDQYAGGAAGREAAIAAGATRSAREIGEDISVWAGRLDDLFESLPEDIWERSVRTVAGAEHPVSQLPFRRWREVEVHLVDLRLGYTARDWPPEFVQRALPRLLAGLADRADRRDLTAWLFGRGGPPTLDPWG